MKSKTIATLIAVLFCVPSAFSVMNPAGQTATGILVHNFAVNSVHHKLYAHDATNKILRVFELYPDSGALVSGVAVQAITCSGPAMALDAMRKKLYIGGSYYGGSDSYSTVFIFDISDTGLLISPPTTHSHNAGRYSIFNMMIDFPNSKIKTTGADNGDWGNWNAVVVSSLDNNGNPSQGQGDVYRYGVSSLAFPVLMLEDLITKKIYRGCNQSYKTSIAGLNSSGNPDTSVVNVLNDYGGISGMAYDAANKQIYWSRSTVIYRWTLDDVGTLSSYDTTPLTGSYQDCVLTVDAVRRKILLCRWVWATGYSEVLCYNLDPSGSIGSYIDSGPSAGDLQCIAYEPFYNKIYVGTARSGGTDIFVYNGLDSAMTPLQINNGESLTEIPNVTLKFQHSNPNYIYMSGDLLSVGSPVGSLNQWKSCGGGFWKNEGDTTRASTLNVSAVLSSGVGEKTVEVWYSWATSKGFSAMMRKATAKITLIESSARVSSINLSRIDYSGARIDYTVVDGRGRNVNVNMQYKTSAKDWTDASPGTGGESLTGLSASINGTAHYAVWDIEKDIEENAKDVQVRMMAENNDSAGVWTETSKFSVPDWNGNDVRAVNVSIKKPNNAWMYRARTEWTGVTDTACRYELQKQEDGGDWSFIATTSGTLYEAENLNETAVYSFRARLRTKEGLFSSYSKKAKIKLTRRISGMATVDGNGGTVFIEDFDENGANNSGVEIPAGTFREEVRVNIEKFGNEYEINGIKKNGTALSESDFAKAVTIRLSYDREEVANKGWNEDNLAIFHYDGLNWVSIGGKVDKTNCLVTARVRHFSKFRVSDNTAKTAIDVLPDAFSPNADGINDVLNFYFSSQAMVENAEIRIYDVNGKIVRAIKGDGTNTLFWDGRMENGSLCETGIYVCVIEYEGKRENRTVRLVK